MLTFLLLYKLTFFFKIKKLYEVIFLITNKQWKEWIEIDELFNSITLQRWMFLWEDKILHQPHYALVMFLRGMSTLLMKHKISILLPDGRLIDPRVPLIYFSPSGSGKGMGAEFYNDIFGDSLGLNITVLKRPTVERLIGSVDSSIIKENRKKGTNKDYHIPGYLELYDDIIFDEAQTLFGKGLYGEEMLRVSRMAMDNYGSKTNKMRSETLKNYVIGEEESEGYSCACNFCFLSTHIKDINEQLLSNGIFQRAICFFYDMTRPQMNDIIAHSITSKGSESRKKKLVKELKGINTFIETQFKPDDQPTIPIKIKSREVKIISDILLNKLNLVYEGSEDVAPNYDLAQLLRCFFPRLKLNFIKLAVGIAISKKKVTIEESDVIDASMIIDLTLNSIENLFKSTYLEQKEKDYYFDTKKMLGNKFLPKEEINTRMASYWKCARSTSISRLKNLKKRGLLKFVKQIKKTQFWKVI